LVARICEWASQQEVHQLEAFISQATQPIISQLITNQSVLAKLQGFAYSTETDGNECPADMVKAGI
jgi:hypothetical protein